MTKSNSTHDDAARYREVFQADDDALREVRRGALEAFEADGFPTRRLEEWRYANPAPITRVAWNLPATDGAVFPADIDGSLPQLGGDRLVFVDGHFVAEASNVETGSGIEFANLAAADADRVARYGEIASPKGNGFTAFNTAFVNDGVVLRVPASASPEAPIQIVFVSSGQAEDRVSFPRLYVDAQPQSRSRIVVDHVSANPDENARRFTCAVVEVCAGEGASVDLCIVQRENPGTYHVAHHAIEQQRDSQVRVSTFALGGAFVRNELEVRLVGSGAHCDLDGLFLGRDEQLIDNHTLVDHAVPHCDSHERYKGIVADAARGVFRGRVLVRPDAQHTNAVQQNQNLVLTAGAEIDTKPQLEIYADDVACSHGSSIGKLDEEALFFLRARALDPTFARRLLMSGFAAEISLAISDEAARAWIDDVVAEELDALTGEER